MDGPSTSSLTKAKRPARHRPGRIRPAREKQQKLQQAVRAQEKDLELHLLPLDTPAHCKCCARTEPRSAFINRGVRLCERCYAQRTVDPKWYPHKAVHVNSRIQEAETETLRRVTTSLSLCHTMHPRSHSYRVHPCQPCKATQPRTRGADVTCHMPPAAQLTHGDFTPHTHQFGNSRATVADLTYSLKVLRLVETLHPRLAKVCLELHPTPIHVRMSSPFLPPNHVMAHPVAAWRWRC